MEASQLRDWVQIVQGLLTIAAISIGGFWAFYVFILGRSSTAHVWIQCKLERAKSVTNGKKVAAVSVTLKNTGRTRVRKEACYVEVAPLAHDQAGRSDLRFVDASPDPLYSVTSTAFEKVEALEPGEEVAEDVLLAWGESPGTSTFGMVVEFKGRVFLGRRSKSWVWRGTFEAGTTGGGGKETDEL